MPKKTKPLDPEHYFFVNDGRVLQSIDDLKKLMLNNFIYKKAGYFAGKWAESVKN